MSQRDFISKANNFPTNKKPRLKSNTRQSGYEHHAVSSTLNWLEGELALIKSTNKKPHECGARCCEKGNSILAIPSSWSA